MCSKNGLVCHVIKIVAHIVGNHWSDLNEQHIETFKSFLEKNIKATSEKLYTQLQRKIKVKQAKFLIFNRFFRAHKMTRNNLCLRILLLSQR
jgi:hypothetical protein